MADQTSSKRVFINTPPPQEKNKKPKKKKLHILFRLILFILKSIGTLILVAFSTAALLACFGAVYIKTVIMPQTYIDLSSFFVNENSMMYYVDSETGEEVQMVTLLNTTSSIWKDYHELPTDLINATVAIEDKRFWEHPGVDWRRTAAAVLYMFTGQDMQGGSTLTQQYIKNLTTYDDVTVKRKIIEIFRALELDSNYSKEEIITRYLNIIYLGEGCEGVGAAAWEYFGKDVMELSLAECASLISITNNPSVYSPYNTLVTYAFPKEGITMTGRERNKYRQELVLAAMLDQGLITQWEHDAAVAEELNFLRSAEDDDTNTVYSWFEEQVITDVRADLMEVYGYSYEAASMMLASGGLSIYTTYDSSVQAIADSVYQNWDAYNITSSGGQNLQSAITIIDNATGDVVAMVGQMGTKERNLLKNFATDASRQPGSSIKPLSVYAPALDAGLITPVAVIDDYPYQMEGGSAWPSNAYGYYRGMTNLEFALQQSSNCIAVRIVGDYLTPQGSYDYMTNVLHFDLVEYTESYGQARSDIAIAPLALGGLTYGVNTRDMAEAYSTFANAGVYTHSRTYSKVINTKGEVILDNTPKQEIAMKDTTAYYINDLLQGVMTSAGTGTKANFSNMTIAGKTGTTNDQYDLWFVGYTPYYTAAVWTGYEYNEKINRSTEPAMTLWKSVMQPLHDGLDNVGFYTPQGLTSVSYCLDSGLIPNSYCSRDTRGSRVSSRLIYAQDAPTATCSAHGPGSSITLCTSSPILNEDGTPSGSYHLAGSYCPSSTTTTSSYVTLNRTNLSGAYARDSSYVYSTSWRGTCTVHTATGTVLPDLPSTDSNTGSNAGSNSDTGSSTTPNTDSPFSDLFPNEDNNFNAPTPPVVEPTPEPEPEPEPAPEPEPEVGIPGVTIPTAPSEPTTPEPAPAPEPEPEPAPTPAPETTTPPDGIPGVVG